MRIDQETFHNAIPHIVECWRGNRQWNLRQRKLPGLLRDWHRSRLLLLQAAYMLISRELSRAEGIVVDYPSASEPSDNGAVVMQNLSNWIGGLTSEKLFAVVHESLDDDLLLMGFIGLYVDNNDMGLEIARQLKPKRFAVELIRTHWGELDEVQETDQVHTIEGLLKSYKTKQFAPGLEERFLKDPAHEEVMINGARHSDLNQSNWLRTLELWKEQIETSQKLRQAERLEALTWFEWIPLLQAEKNFFDGPITRAWQGSLKNVLADFDSIPEVDLIPRKLRDVKAAAVEKIERRHMQTHRLDEDRNDDQEGEPPEGDVLVDTQVFQDWNNEERN